MRDISSALGKNFDFVIKEMYIDNKMSAQEISEKLFHLTKISITTRSVQRVLKALGLTRSFSEAFNLSIKKGRKSYEHLRRPIKSRELRRGINPRLRYQIMQRDAFKCVLCGKTAKDERLVIDQCRPCRLWRHK